MRSAEIKTVGLQRSPTVFSGRVVACKAFPDPMLDQVMNYLMHDRQQLESVDTLAQGMNRSLDGDVDRLFVNATGASPDELTALLIFREVKPDQKIVVFCESEMVGAMARMMGFARQDRTTD